MSDVEAERSEADEMVARMRTLSARGDVRGALALAEQIVERFGATRDDGVQECVAAAIWEQAASWRTLDTPDRRSAALAQLIERWGASSNPQLASYVMQAFYWRAFDLENAGDVVDAEALYNETLRRARAAQTPSARDVAMHATLGRARLISWRGLHKDALADLNRLLEDFTDLIPEHPVWLADVLTTKMQVMKLAADDAELVTVADELIDRLAESTDRAVRLQVAGALVWKLESLARLSPGEQQSRSAIELLVDRFAEEGVEVLDFEIERVDRERDPAWQRTIAPYLFVRGMLLRELGRDDESIDAMRAVIELQASSSDTSVATAVGEARRNLAEWVGQ